VLTLLAPKAAALREGAGLPPVGFELLPPSGGAVRLEASDIFVRWETLTDVTGLFPSVEFTDTGAGQQTQRFYSLRPSPSTPSEELRR